jgi:hypothetical protein
VVHSAVLLQTSQFELQASQLSGAYFPNLSLHVVHSFPSTHTLQLAGHAVHRSAAKYSGIGVVQSHKSVQLPPIVPPVKIDGQNNKITPVNNALVIVTNVTILILVQNATQYTH